jgi:hypothetical protein
MEGEKTKKKVNGVKDVLKFFNKCVHVTDPDEICCRIMARDYDSINQGFTISLGGMVCVSIMYDFFPFFLFSFFSFPGAKHWYHS